MEYHHGPLSNNWFLFSIFGLLFNYPIWALSPAWGFTLLVFFLIMFIASYVSAMRAPLVNGFDDPLAVHQIHLFSNYPDTDSHHGLIHEEKVELHPWKRKVSLDSHKAQASRSKKKVVRKVATKKKPAKTLAKRKTVKRAAPKRVTKKTVKRSSPKRTVKKPATKKAKSRQKPLKKRRR